MRILKNVQTAISSRLAKNHSFPSFTVFQFFPKTSRVHIYERVEAQFEIFNFERPLL